MRDLDGLHDAAELDMLMAPVELAHLAGCEGQRDKGVREGRAGRVGLPAPHEALHAVVGATVTLRLQTFEEPPGGAALGFREKPFGPQPGLQPLLDRSQHRGQAAGCADRTAWLRSGNACAPSAATNSGHAQSS